MLKIKKSAHEKCFGIPGKSVIKVVEIKLAKGKDVRSFLLAEAHNSPLLPLCFDSHTSFLHWPV